MSGITAGGRAHLPEESGHYLHPLDFINLVIVSLFTAHKRANAQYRFIEGKEYKRGGPNGRPFLVNS
jgi:hypothetical protein